MSNILIIKHGSLGDIVQISGALKDIKEHHKDDKIFILTTLPYVDLLSRCPFVDAVLIDKRLSRWNIFYLFKLSKMIKKYNFSLVYDLQNSSRTSFYRKYLLKISNWCSTETTLKPGTQKKDFDRDPVLERFKFQLEMFNLKTNYTTKPNFSWAISNVDSIINKYFGKKFIMLLPFSSPHLKNKIWPHYNNLIEIIKLNHKNLEIVIAPGPNEIGSSKNINAITVLKKNKSINIMELTGLINKSSFVIANDTGPAHIAAHLGKDGICIFGTHTSPRKVSIETDSFKAMSVNDLNTLSADEVYLKIQDKLKSIN